ncbi:MAG: hypothetical protein ACK59A_09195 [Cyanobacteriota bacterium]|jgi:hypothetical protein
MSDQEYGRKIVYDLIFIAMFVVILVYFNVIRSDVREIVVHLRKVGVLTSARVLRLPPVFSGDDPSYFVSYDFTHAGPKGKSQHSGTVSVSKVVYDALAQVRYADVRYFPEDPRTSCLELDCEFSNNIVVRWW